MARGARLKFLGEANNPHGHNVRDTICDGRPSSHLRRLSAANVSDGPRVYYRHHISRRPNRDDDHHR